MTFVLWTVVASVCWLASIAFAYGVGARGGYWRGVARGQHVAGRQHMQVMANVLYGEEMPPIDPDELRPGRKPN